MAMSQSSSSDFVIWGPALASGAMVLNAVHALYFLPKEFKLVLPPVHPSETDWYERVRSLIARDGLARRVSFSQKQVPAEWQAVIVDKPADVQPGYIFGSTPEAIASAILDASRAMK